MKYKALLMDAAAVNRVLKRVSHEILERNGGSENICIIGIERCGVPLAKTIADNIYEIEGKKIPVGSVDITLYRDDLTEISEEAIFSGSKIDFSVEGKSVILVDDVLFTGRTVRAALEALIKQGRPKSVQLAVLIDRGHRELPIRGDYVGKNVPTSKNEYISVKLPPIDDELSVTLNDR